MKATWNGQVIAESSETIVVESNQYFPPNSVNQDYLRQSKHQTVCGWKGTASYYDVVVEGKTLEQAAWYYAEPRKAADNIKGYVAFWKGVQVHN